MQGQFFDTNDRRFLTVYSEGGVWPPQGVVVHHKGQNYRCSFVCVHTNGMVELEFLDRIYRTNELASPGLWFDKDWFKYLNSYIVQKNNGELVELQRDQVNVSDNGEITVDTSKPFECKPAFKPLTPDVVLKSKI